jgi:ATP-dependent DNA helicase PIF1
MQNAELEIAEQFALQTNKHFFLTGKAGTGKTTLLRNIAKKTSKNYVIVAPTGVAAINAGGVTIHSMFHLPISTFIPTTDYVDMNVATNRKLLATHMKFRKEKLRVIQEMEMLIIDEISMVRCDVLDAVDFALQTVRRSRLPFGGVQVMAIGDMHQLPPVVKNEEWELLKKYYSSPYFFSSHVWQSIDAAHIELKQIFRQSDETFLAILNNIRHQQMDEFDYEKLKERYQPDFNPTGDGYILLCTHNNTATSVNEQKLEDLPGRNHLFEAVIKVDFPFSMFPCDETLRLKEGAQVMFIKNDVDEGKYFNGKLAVVKKIEDGDIIVTFNDSGENYKLKRETWENVSYSLEDGSEKIKKDVQGTFSQYPLRLAWAITIHKSQGLTFDKVIIDAGQSFAAGQVYVALSRCRTLEGIVLHSVITPRSLHGDPRITEFTDSHQSVHELKNVLESERALYAHHLLRKLFSFDKLETLLAEWKELLLEKDIPEKDAALRIFGDITFNLNGILNTSRKFNFQLDKLLGDFQRDEKKYAVLKERSSKAIDYFTENIFTKIITPLHGHVVHMAFKAKVKMYVRQLHHIESLMWNKMEQLYQSKFIDDILFTGEVKYNRSMLPEVKGSVTDESSKKGGTYRDTLELYKQGNSVTEIADMRSLTIGTIKGHIAKWIGEGEIAVEDVLPEEYIQRIKDAIKKYGADNFPALKSHFGNAFDYADIRMVISSFRKEKV